jgi:hypothetical protein
MTAIAPDSLTLKDIRESLTRIEEGQTKLAVEVAYIRGQVSEMPTNWQMLMAIVAIVFTTLAGTAGVLFAALSYAK